MRGGGAHSGTSSTGDTVVTALVTPRPTVVSTRQDGKAMRVFVLTTHGTQTQEAHQHAQVLGCQSSCEICFRIVGWARMAHIGNCRITHIHTSPTTIDLARGVGIQLGNVNEEPSLCFHRDAAATTFTKPQAVRECQFAPAPPAHWHNLPLRLEVPRVRVQRILQCIQPNNRRYNNRH